MKSKKSIVKSNFTLIEILTVCSLIAFLMAMMVAGYSIVQQKGRESRCRSTLEVIKTALTSYKAKTGYYIQQKDVGDFVVDDPDNNTPNFSGYVNYEKMKNSGEMGDKISASSEQRPLIDPWHNNYRYQCPGKHNRGSFDLWSAGPDGNYDTDDDIKNWE